MLPDFCFAESSRSLVRALVLFNCAGGMNNKAIVDDWRIKLFLPLLWLIDFLLKQRGIASYLFDRARQRYLLISLSFHLHNFVEEGRQRASCWLYSCRENLRNVLLSVYGNKENVDDELVEVRTKCFWFAHSYKSYNQVCMLAKQ